MSSREFLDIEGLKEFLENCKETFSDIDHTHIEFDDTIPEEDRITQEEFNRQMTAQWRWQHADISVGGDPDQQHEYWTGRVSVGGNQIYGKVVDFGALPNNSGRDVHTFIENIETVITLRAVAQSDTETMIIPNGVNPEGWGAIFNAQAVAIRFFQNTGIIRIITGNDRTGWNALVMLEYTCTDR